MNLNIKTLTFQTLCSIQAFLISFVSGVSMGKIQEMSAYSNITREMMEEMFKLKVAITILAILFFATIFGLLNKRKWPVFISLTIFIITILVVFSSLI